MPSKPSAFAPKIKRILKIFKKILRFFDQNLYGKFTFLTISLVNISWISDSAPKLQHALLAMNYHAPIHYPFECLLRTLKSKLKFRVILFLKLTQNFSDEWHTQWQYAGKKMRYLASKTPSLSSADLHPGSQSIGSL